MAIALCPLFYFAKGVFKVHEELRLISIGFPLSEALGICHALRKEGTLEEFVKEQERKYREVCNLIVDEAID